VVTVELDLPELRLAVAVREQAVAAKAEAAV
jgi:hypothetical protein